jgi:hypothetical protein
MSSEHTFFLMMAFLGLTVVVLAVAIVYSALATESRAHAELRRVGLPAQAIIMSFRRISVTQHHVLFRIEGPSGPVGREYVVSGLADTWLADVSATQRPVSVIWAPNIHQVIVESSPMR